MVVYGGICTVVLDSVPEYYGIEEHGVAVNDREGIEIPSSSVILSDAQLHQFQDIVNPLTESDNFGIELYLQALDISSNFH